MTMTARRGYAVTAMALVLAIGACGASSDASALAGVPASSAAPQSGRAPSRLQEGNPCSMLLPARWPDPRRAISMREIVDEDTCAFPFSQRRPGAGRGWRPRPAAHHHRPLGRRPAAVTATRMASKLFGGDAGFQKLQGIGDEAWLGPMASMLVFSKGRSHRDRPAADSGRQGQRDSPRQAHRVEAAVVWLLASTCACNSRAGGP